MSENWRNVIWNLPEQKTWEHVQVALLMDIRGELQLIRSLLDPVQKAQTEMMAHEEAVWRAWQRIRLNSGQEKSLLRRTREYLAPANPDGKERQAITYAVGRLGEWCRGDWWDKRCAGIAPTPEDETAFRARLAFFDPATFDWAALKLRGVRGERFGHVLARRKALPG